jgi:hypothetical protein
MDSSRNFRYFVIQIFDFFLSQEAIQELHIQIDKFEADIETLSVSLKKKKSDKDVSLLN